MSRSKELLDRASDIIPGGVNSPVRAYSAVGNVPPFIDHAEGSHIYDVDGNGYIDYVGSWGPMIAGHANKKVLARITETMKKGTSFGAPTELEIEMAEKVIEMVPSVEMVRMVNSGTEATLSAIRVARGFTGRDMIIKFDGCYHGHGDSLLVSAGSGVETLGLPDSPGVPAGIAELTKSLPYNDLETLENVLAKEGEKIACIILEPVIGNMGLILPEDGFLAGVRSLCDKHGVLLIFDEVMTGFRLAKGGAQELFGIRPDITTLGKIIGGGLPVGAYGGRKDIMNRVAPAGPIYQAGTLSGNPLAMSAGLAMLEILCEPGVYDRLETSTARLLDGLLAAAKSAGLEVCGSRVGSMFGIYFTHLEKVRNYVEAKTADTELFGRWHAGMLAEGVYLAPSQFEAGFMSLAHSDEDISATISAAEKVLPPLSRGV